MDRLMTLMLSLPGIVAGLAMHEYAHAVAADALGDDTPRLAGRLTPEPWAHLDPLGSLLIALFGFGWGKAVPVNPMRFRNPRRDFMLVALAGPVTNLVMAFLFGIGFGIASASGASTVVKQIMQASFFINANLAAFNLIPLHPLDGSKVLVSLLPDNMATAYDSAATYSPLILALLMGTHALSPYLNVVGAAITDLIGVPGVMLGRTIMSLF